MAVGDSCMAEQLLNRTDIITAFQMTRGKIVAQYVTIYSFGNIGLYSCLSLSLFEDRKGYIGLDFLRGVIDYPCAF